LTIRTHLLKKLQPSLKQKKISTISNLMSWPSSSFLVSCSRTPPTTLNAPILIFDEKQSLNVYLRSQTSQAMSTTAKNYSYPMWTRCSRLSLSWAVCLKPSHFQQFLMKCPTSPYVCSLRMRSTSCYLNTKDWGQVA
jgi:hypothetical protein